MDAQRVETLLEVERVAGHSQRDGEDENLPEAMKAAYNAGNGADDIARVTGLPLDAVLEMLELDSGA